MRTRLRVIAAVALAALALTACTQPDTAATVDSVTISDSEAIALGGLDADALTLSGNEFRAALNLLVIQQALLNAAEDDYGIVGLETDEGRETYLDSASESQLSLIAQQIQAGTADGRDLDAVEDFVITQVALGDLARTVILGDPAFQESVWETQADLLVGVCASHILVATEAEALDVIDRLDAGEDFAEVAADVSLDTQTPGGVLPCPTPAVTFVPQFAEVVMTLPIGEISDPVQSEFGFHVVRVDDRIEPTSLEEVEADPARYIPPQLVDAEYNRWINEVLGAADIEVRSQIGTWNPQIDAIAAPPDSP